MNGMDYPSCLCDKQWQLIQKVLPPASQRGRKRINRRRIINAILYVCRTGCQWRYLPKEFPHWNTVYGIFRQWKLDGVWLDIHELLRNAVRRATGKNAAPTVGIIDSQSIRTAEGGEIRGYDAGKKITGRKRHILVDTLGMLLMVVVHSADIQDFDGGSIVMRGIRGLYRRLKIVFADGAYGKCGLPQQLKERDGIQLQTVLRPIDAKGFQVLPKRWVVERTFAWINRRRRLSKDYERLTETSETMIYISMIDLMSRRLAKL
jgi:putative transposase